MKPNMFSLLCGIAAFALILSSCSEKCECPTGTGTSQEFTMDKAATYVVDSIIPTEVPEGGRYICLRLDDILPAGSTIEEDAPTNPRGGRANFSSQIELEEDSYFFYLDLEPGAYFEHPVKYIVISKSSRKAKVTEARWWPIINGEVPEQILADAADPKYIVSSNTTLHFSVPQGMTLNAPVSSPDIKEGFLLIQGLMPGEKLFSDACLTYMNAMIFFLGYKNSNSILMGLSEGEAKLFSAGISELANQGARVITIFIICHGSVDWIRLSGESWPVITLYSAMNYYPDMDFNLILNSCHSGSFIDDLQSLPNVRVIATSCKTNEISYADWDNDYYNGNLIYDYNPEDDGSEWSSSIFLAMASISGDETYWNSLVNYARLHEIPVTSALIWQGHHGAIGANAPYGLIANLDFSNIMTTSTPQVYRSWAE